MVEYEDPEFTSSQKQTKFTTIYRETAYENDPRLAEKIFYN